MDGFLGPPARCQLSFAQLFWLGGEPPTKIDYKKVGTLILSSLLEDLGMDQLRTIMKVDWFCWKRRVGVQNFSMFSFCDLERRLWGGFGEGMRDLIISHGADL